MNIKNPQTILNGLTDCDYSLISPFFLYLELFKKLPNNIQNTEIDCQKYQQQFEKKYSKEIIERRISDYTSLQNNELIHHPTHLYVLKNKIIVTIESRTVIICYDQNVSEDFLNEALKFRKIETKTSTEIGLILSKNGLYVKTVKIKENKLDYLNYNADFERTDLEIKQNLDKDKLGIYLLYGDAGTGKTSYIRHLAGVCSKKFLIVSSVFLSALDSPEFITLLLDNPNCVLILEDAERILTSREDNSHSPVAALLNLSDGFVGQAINLQIICTFNTSYNKIDKALLRKGRLIKSYEFKKLEVSRVEQLAKKLEKKIETRSPMSLADIYNFEQESTKLIETRPKIGFSK